MSPTEQPASASTPLETPTPPISRAKHTRIDIWRNEVAALTLDTSHDSKSSSSRQSPPPSSATSSASSSSGVLSSPGGDSRARRLWNRLSSRLTGRPVQPPLQDVIRTEMYRVEPPPPPSAALPKPDDEGQEITVESSREDGGRGGLKEKQERLERAARLLEQGA